MNAKDFFQRVVVINLDRRNDRWNHFVTRLPSNWPVVPPERVPAIDGQLIRPPSWWTAGPGAWGCYRTHLRILEDCLNRGLENVLILEDDAVFCPDFSVRFGAFLEHVPTDWDMLYLGGQLLNTAQVPPRRVNEHVFAAYNINRTQAYAVGGREFMIGLHRYLHEWDGWIRGHHLDHHLGRLHARKKHRIYVPGDWLVGQAAGESDICGRSTPERYWISPAADALASEQYSKFAVVLGLHSSGSSALAGVLYHLGLHLGNKLGGYYGADPERSCGFEAAGLARLCEAAIPFPTTQLRVSPRQIAHALRRWISQRRGEAVKKRTLAACKYPMLCRLGDPLLTAAGDALRIIHIDRPLEESIASLIRRCPRHDPRHLEAHQGWLWQGKREFLTKVPKENIFDVQYSRLLTDPVQIIAGLVSFLGIEAVPARVERASASVDPAKRHIANLVAVA